MKIHLRIIRSAVQALITYIVFMISLITPKIVNKAGCNLLCIMDVSAFIFHCPHKKNITQNLFFKCLYFFFNFFFFGDFYFNTKWWQLKLCEIKHINNNYNWKMAQTFPAHKLRITWSQRHFFWNFKNRMLKKFSPQPPPKEMW